MFSMGFDNSSIDQKNRLIPINDEEDIESSDVGASYVVAPTKKSTHLAVLEDKEETLNLINERNKYVKGQKLYKAAHEGAPLPDLLDLTIQEVASEISHLKWERNRAIEGGKSTSGHSIARISSLKSLVDILTKKQESIKDEKLNLSSPRFKTIVKFWLELVYESMTQANIKQEEIDLIFSYIRTNMADWEKKILDITE